VPAYIAQAEELKRKGVDEVLIFTTNDGATTASWREFKFNDFGGNASDFVKILADPPGDLAKACDLELTASGPLGTLGHNRSKRFAALVEDGIVKWFAISESEDDPAGDVDPSNSMPDAVLKVL